MRRILMAAVLAVAVSPAALADEKPADKSPEDQYQALTKSVQEDQQAILKSLREAKTNEERQKVFADYSALGKKYADRFLKLAEKNPKAEAAVDALVWVVLNTQASNDTKKDDPRERAIGLLKSDHITSKKLLRCIQRLSSETDDSSRSLLQTLMDKGGSREIKGRACVALAESDVSLARNVTQIKSSEQMREAYEKYFGKKTVETILKNDPEKLRKEAEDLFERVEHQYGDVKPERGPDLGTVAKRFLFQLRKLAVGQKAPDVEGTNLEGKTEHLKDLRGKVVVLDIWATWCGPCRAMIPHERELVKRLKDKPFVLVSVSADAKEDTLKAFLKKESMPWTHWYSGPESGIVADWNVRYFPTIYVIDATGTIRYHDVRGEEMDKAVDKLLKEAEKKSSK